MQQSDENEYGKVFSFFLHKQLKSNTIFEDHFSKLSWATFCYDILFAKSFLSPLYLSHIGGQLCRQQPLKVASFDHNLLE